MARIVLTADNHLSAYYAKMSPSQLEKRRKALRDSFEQVIQFAKENADIFCHAGDLFDSTEPLYADLLFVLNCFLELKKASVESFLISGTHDTPKGRDRITPQRFLESLGLATFFKAKTKIETTSRLIRGQKIVIGGLSTDNRLPPGEDPLRGMSFPDEGDLNILLLHYGVQDHYIPAANDPIVSLSSIEALEKVHLFGIGHFHRPQNFRLGRKSVIIPGATEHLDFGERGSPPGFYHIITSSKELECDFHTVDAQPMIQLDIRSGEINFESDPTLSIIQAIERNSKENALFKLRVKGILPREKYHSIQWGKIQQVGRNLNFFFDLDTAQLQIEGFKPQNITASTGFSEREEIIAQAEERAKNNEEERELIREALELIFSQYRLRDNR